MNVTGDPGHADIDQLMTKKNSKTGKTDMLFLRVKPGNLLLINVLVSF